MIKIESAKTFHLGHKMIKSIRVLLIILCLFNFQIYACTIDGTSGIAPENNLRIPVGLKSNSELKTEAQVESILSTLSNYFSPLVRSFGARLVVENHWYNKEVNAYAFRAERNVYIIRMQGGLARFPDMTEDAFVLVFCHVLGHHRGCTAKGKSKL